MKYIRPKRAIIILHIFLFIYAKLLQKEERTKDLNIFCIAKEEGEVKSEESNGGSEERRIQYLRETVGGYGILAMPTKSAG